MRRLWIACILVPLAFAMPVQAGCHSLQRCAPVDGSVLDSLAATRGTTKCGADFAALAHLGNGMASLPRPDVEAGGWLVIQVSFIQAGSGPLCEFSNLGGAERDPVAAKWHEPWMEDTGSDRTEHLIGVDLSALTPRGLHPIAFNFDVRNSETGEIEHVRTWVNVNVDSVVSFAPLPAAGAIREDVDGSLDAQQETALWVALGALSLAVVVSVAGWARAARMRRP